MKTKLVAVSVFLAALGACAKPQPEQPIRTCVDKSQKVVDESMCQTAGAGSAGFEWLYLYMLLRPGTYVQNAQHVAPTSNFRSYSSALTAANTAPKPVAAVEPPRSSAPIKEHSSSSGSFKLPTSSAPVKSFSSPSYSRPSTSFSSPSYSRPSTSFSPSPSSARYR